MGGIAIRYSVREKKATEIFPSAVNAHFPPEQTVSLPLCAGSGHGEAAEQTAQQAIQLGSDTAKEKKKQEHFFHQPTHVCAVLSWE